MLRRKAYYTGMGLLFCIFLITRVWRIDMIPFGLHYDEAGMAYDAWCLSQYGVDRYLDSWPLYLPNYGGGQSVLYAYLCAGFFKIFGYHFLLIRLPAILFSVLTFVFGIKIMEKLYPDEWMPAFAVGLLLTICPALILQGRLGLDCYLVLGTSTVFLYLFLCAVEGSGTGYYIGAGFTGGMLLYTYALTYFILPFFLLMSLLYVIRVKKFLWKGWFAMSIPMALLAVPLILIQIINLFDFQEVRMGCFTLTKLDFYRVGEFSAFRVLQLLQTLWYVFLKSDFMYVSVPGFMNLYVLTIPFFCVGLASLLKTAYKSMKKRESNSHIYLLIYFMSYFLLFGFLSPNGYRITGIYFVVIAIAVCGFWKLCSFEMGKAGKRLVLKVQIAVVAMYFIAFMKFAHYYYMGGYAAETTSMIHFDILVKEGIEYLENHPEYQNMGTYMAEPVTFYVLSTLKSPYMYRYEPNILDSDYYICGSLPEIQDGYNYIVRNIYWDYMEELREKGYTEVKFTGYSLFYQE